jgi:hypothetical protein
VVVRRRETSDSGFLEAQTTIHSRELKEVTSCLWKMGCRKVFLKCDEADKVLLSAMWVCAPNWNAPAGREGV